MDAPPPLCGDADLRADDALHTAMLGYRIELWGIETLHSTLAPA